MSHFKPIITQAGLNAAVGADNINIKVNITHIGIGDQGYTPRREHTGLSNERMRVEVAEGHQAGDTHWQVAGLFDSGPEFAVREVGFYLDDGTLFGLWSHPENIMFWNTPLNKTVEAYDLFLEALPVDVVNVISNGSLNIFFDSEFAQMAAVQIGNMNRHLKTLISQTLHL